MRLLCLTTILGLVSLCGGCRGSGGSAAAGLPAADQKTRLVLNGYRGLASVFVMENLAGRNLVELRSKPLRANRPAVAYVEDDVMKKLMKQLERAGFFKYRQPRPPDPLQFGAKSEFTMIEADGKRTTILKIRLMAGQPVEKRQLESLKAFVASKAEFLKVYNRHRPQMQTRVNAGGQDPFGVRRATDTSTGNTSR